MYNLYFVLLFVMGLILYFGKELVNNAMYNITLTHRGARSWDTIQSYSMLLNGRYRSTVKTFLLLLISSCVFYCCRRRRLAW